MKEKLIRFMQGRYGVDQFSKFLLVLGLIAVVVSSVFVDNIAGLVFYILGWALVIYCYFRVFSRNIQKRYAENQGVSGKNIWDPQFFPEAEKYLAAAQGLPYLYMSVLQTEDPYPKRKGKDRGALSEMRDNIYQEKLTGNSSL